MTLPRFTNVQRSCRTASVVVLSAVISCAFSDGYVFAEGRPGSRESPIPAKLIARLDHGIVRAWQRRSWFLPSVDVLRGGAAEIPCPVSRNSEVFSGRLALEEAALVLAPQYPWIRDRARLQKIRFGRDQKGREQIITDPNKLRSIDTERETKISLEFVGTGERSLYPLTRRVFVTSTLGCDGLVVLHDKQALFPLLERACPREMALAKRVYVYQLIAPQLTSTFLLAYVSLHHVFALPLSPEEVNKPFIVSDLDAVVIVGGNVAAGLVVNGGELLNPGVLRTAGVNVGAGGQRCWFVVKPLLLRTQAGPRVGYYYLGGQLRSRYGLGSYLTRYLEARPRLNIYWGGAARANSEYK